MGAQACGAFHGGWFICVGVADPKTFERGGYMINGLLSSAKMGAVGDGQTVISTVQSK